MTPQLPSMPCWPPVLVQQTPQSPPQALLLLLQSQPVQQRAALLLSQAQALQQWSCLLRAQHPHPQPCRTQLSLTREPELLFPQQLQPMLPQGRAVWPALVSTHCWAALQASRFPEDPGRSGHITGHRAWHRCVVALHLKVLSTLCHWGPEFRCSLKLSSTLSSPMAALKSSSKLAHPHQALTLCSHAEDSNAFLAMLYRSCPQPLPTAGTGPAEPGPSAGASPQAMAAPPRLATPDQPVQHGSAAGVPSKQYVTPAVCVCVSVA